MQVQTTSLDGVLLFVPTPFRDERGFFSRTFDAADARAAGLDPDAFVQDSQSRSARGVVRGMHGRRGGGEAKLVRCAHGAIHDVVVDARRGLADVRADGGVPARRRERCTRSTSPAGSCTASRPSPTPPTPATASTPRTTRREDVSVAFDDPELAIAWPLPPSMVSDRDRAAGSWAEARALLAPAHA